LFCVLEAVCLIWLDVAAVVDVLRGILQIAQTGSKEDFYSGIRQPKCEADHSFPSSVEVKKQWM
jgi:hypothetical protein